jgi:non-heme chloroperoxidase
MNGKRCITLSLSVALLTLNPPGLALAEFVQISDDVSLHFEAAGDGVIPIVFVPGWTMSEKVFERQYAHFAHSPTYKFFSYDPRSQGISSHTLNGNDYEQHGRDLHAFIEKLTLKNVVLAGWSNGAYDILSYVNQYGSDNIRGFILIDGPPKGTAADNTKEWSWFSKDDADGSRAYYTLGALRDRQKLNKEFGAWMVAKATPEYLQWISDISNQTSNDVAALTNESAAYMDFTKDAEKLSGRIPILYLVREEWRPIATDWIGKHTPHSSVTVLGRHMMFWEYPEQFNASLDAYLMRLK